MTSWEEHCDHEAGAMYDDVRERYAAEIEDARREAAYDLAEQEELAATTHWVRELRFERHAQECVRTFLAAVTAACEPRGYIAF